MPKAEGESDSSDIIKITAGSLLAAAKCVAMISVRGKTVTLQMTPEWYRQLYDLRFQQNRALWNRWFEVHAPAPHDGLIVRLVNNRGIDVGLPGAREAAIAETKK